MPRCLHAMPRRAKNPKGLPPANAIFRERIELVREYHDLCNETRILATCDAWSAEIGSLRSVVARMRGLAARRAAAGAPA